MILTRRGFTAGLIAALATPAIVRAESIMRVVVPKSGALGWDRRFHDAIVFEQIMNLNRTIHHNFIYGEMPIQEAERGQFMDFLEATRASILRGDFDVSQVVQ